jgi:hypothetical protein
MKTPREREIRDQERKTEINAFPLPNDGRVTERLKIKHTYSLRKGISRPDNERYDLRSPHTPLFNNS